MRYLRAFASLSVTLLAFTAPGVLSSAQDAPKSDQVEIKQVEVRLSDHGPVILLKA